MSAMLDAQRPGRTSDAAARAQIDHAAAITANAGTSFYWGMRILPRARREAMYAIYAFCREVDDIADGPQAPEARMAGLDKWRAEIDRVFDGAPKTMTGRALVGPVRTFGLERGDFLAVIDGVAMDAREEMRAPSTAVLKQYCARVAGAVGLLSIRAFGDGSRRARDLALALGEALQLTNILRDLREDAERGRLYLPREWLDEANVPHDPPAALRAPGLAHVCARVAALAHENFRAAQAAMRLCDTKAMKPARLMGATYAAILSRLERRGWSRHDERVSLPAWQKLWLALRYGLA